MSDTLREIESIISRAIFSESREAAFALKYSAVAAIEQIESERDQLRAEISALQSQLSRICKEGFNNDDTIGGEPADDYVLRQIGKLKDDPDIWDKIAEYWGSQNQKSKPMSTEIEIEWSEPNERGVICGCVKGIPETTVALIRISEENPDRGTMAGAFIPDDCDGKGRLMNGLLTYLKAMAPLHVSNFIKKANELYAL